METNKIIGMILIIIGIIVAIIGSSMLFIFIYSPLSNMITPITLIIALPFLSLGSYLLRKK